MGEMTFGEFFFINVVSLKYILQSKILCSYEHSLSSERPVTIAVVPSSDHGSTVIETVAPSGDHYCIDIVVPSSDH